MFGKGSFDLKLVWSGLYIFSRNKGPFRVWWGIEINTVRLICWVGGILNNQGSISYSPLYIACPLRFSQQFINVCLYFTRWVLNTNAENPETGCKCMAMVP